MKTIELPKMPGDLYRFGELPHLIAEALYPAHLGKEDWLLSCVIWNDDGGDGTYFRCSPPDGEQCTSLDDIRDIPEWSITPIELTEEERLHPDRCKWVNRRWHAQRLPADQKMCWPDGSLIIDQEWTQGQFSRSIFLKSQSDWYGRHLKDAALIDAQDPARLCVLDALGNELDSRAGPSLDGGRVHLDELNRWGAVQRPPRVFTLIGAVPVAELAHPIIEEPSVETQEQRQARRWKMCIDAGLQMPVNDYERLPRGIRKIAEKEGITRQSLAEDLKAYVNRRSSSKTAGE